VQVHQQERGDLLQQWGDELFFWNAVSLPMQRQRPVCSGVEWNALFVRPVQLLIGMSNLHGIDSADDTSFHDVANLWV
jgi:hypothetical protein